MNTGSSFAVEVTVSVGIDIGIADVVAGLSAEVATTEQKATSQGATVPCPEGTWKCALKIFPNILSVSGKKVAVKGREAYCNPGEDHGLGPYTVELPVLGDNKAVESRVEVCACKNYPGAEDEGAPVEKCDECP